MGGTPACFKGFIISFIVPVRDVWNPHCQYTNIIHILLKGLMNVALSVPYLVPSHDVIIYLKYKQFSDMNVQPLHN